MVLIDRITVDSEQRETTRLKFSVGLCRIRIEAGFSAAHDCISVVEQIYSERGTDGFTGWFAR